MILKIVAVMIIVRIIAANTSEAYRMSDKHAIRNSVISPNESVR